MRSITMCLASIAVLAGFSTNAEADLIGLSSNFPAAASIYSIDSVTGSASPIATLSGINKTSFVGLEYMNGSLYATNVFSAPGAGNGYFGTINLNTGAFSPINNQGNSINWIGLAGDSNANLLYTVDQDIPGLPLLSITPGGVVTTIGLTSTALVGLAYDANSNILYGVDPTALYTINTSTGATTSIGLTGLNDFYQGLAYDSAADLLYLNSSTNLYSVNKITGLATLIGSNSLGATPIDGLAYIPVPEPTVMLLGMIVIGCLFWKSKTSNRGR